MELALWPHRHLNLQTHLYLDLLQVGFPLGNVISRLSFRWCWSLYKSQVCQYTWNHTCRLELVPEGWISFLENQRGFVCMCMSMLTFKFSLMLCSLRLEFQFLTLPCCCRTSHWCCSQFQPWQAYDDVISQHEKIICSAVRAINVWKMFD